MNYRPDWSGSLERPSDRQHSVKHYQNLSIMPMRSFVRNALNSGVTFYALL